MNNAMTECGVLVGIQTMMGQLAKRHPADRVDKVLTVQVLKPILIRVMSVGMMIEVMCRRVFDTVLVTSILRQGQNTCNNGDRELMRYSSLLYMKGVIALPALVWLPA